MKQHADAWFIAREGQQHGPISDQEMQAMISQGRLKPMDMVWRDGFTEWQPANLVFRSDQPKPPPILPASQATKRKSAKQPPTRSLLSQLLLGPLWTMEHSPRTQLIGLGVVLGALVGWVTRPNIAGGSIQPTFDQITDWLDSDSSGAGYLAATNSLQHLLIVMIIGAIAGYGLAFLLDRNNENR